MKTHYSILFFIYIAIVFFCNYTLGIFHLTDVHYHKIFDTYSYLDAAKLMLNAMKAHSLRCFGYAGVLTLPYTLFKLTPAFFWFIYIVQNGILLLTFHFIYKLVAFYTNEKKAFWATFLLIINITYIVFSFHVMSEIGFLFLMTAAFYYIHLYFINQQSRNLLFSFLAICLATLFRPGLFHFTLLFGILLALYLLIKKKNWVAFGMVFLIFLSSIGFQAYKIQQQFGMYKISFIDDVTLYRYLNTSAIAKIEGKDKLYLMSERDSALYLKLKNVDSRKAFIAYHEIVKKETSDLISNHTAHFIFAFLDNLFTNFHTGNAFIRDMPEDKILNKEIQKRLFDYTRIWNMLFVIVLALTNVFLLVLFIRKKINWNNDGSFLSSIILFYCNYCFVTSGISYFQGDRFNVVWMPMLLIFIFINFRTIKNILKV